MSFKILSCQSLELCSFFFLFFLLFFFFFFLFWVLGLKEKGHEWFGRERFWDWKRSRLQVREKRRKKEIKKKKEDIFSFNTVYLVC